MTAKKQKEEQKTEESNDFNLNEKYMQMQMFDQQLSQLNKYIEAFDQQISEINNLIKSINEFANLKKGDEILAPIANGVFLKANLKDNSELLVNVGSNVVVNKSIPDVIKLLEKQESELTLFKKETTEQIEKLTKELEKMQQ